MRTRRLPRRKMLQPSWESPFRYLNLTQRSAAGVIEPFMEAYLCGETPNPCIYCNRRLKFGLFLERALEMGFGGIATGHYVRKERAADGSFLLRRAADETKDQSYVLYMLTQAQLARIYFPLGDKTKREVRELALSLGLAAGQSRESQDICFIPDGDYRAYLERERPGCLRPGNFVSVSGEVLGRHKGTAALHCRPAPGFRRQRRRTAVRRRQGCIRQYRDSRRRSGFVSEAPARSGRQLPFGPDAFRTDAGDGQAALQPEACACDCLAGGRRRRR